MTSETLPQAYRVRIPEELQPALDALSEEARTALLAALFERAMQPVAAGTSPQREPLQVSGLQAELERDPVHARLTLVSLRAAFAPPAPTAPGPALVAQESAQAAWERAGAL